MNKKTEIAATALVAVGMATVMTLGYKAGLRKGEAAAAIKMREVIKETFAQFNAEKEKNAN